MEDPKDELMSRLAEITGADMTAIEKMAARTVAAVEAYQCEVALQAAERNEDIIRHVDALRAEGYTLRQISDELAARGCFSRNAPAPIEVHGSEL